jgi:RNA polymerase sigma-70 factor (ECF subfamily)
LAHAGHDEYVGADYADLSDEELWRRADDREGAAFGELFDRHSMAVYNHCFRRTGSWDDAQDLTSVVFMEAWRKRKEVRLHGDSILPWLLAVANNVARNADRSIRRRRRLLSKLPAQPAATNNEADLDQGIDDERAMTSILAKLAILRVEEQEVIALCDWADLSYSEAATALGIPIGTVRSRLSRAHARLRECVEGEQHTDSPVVLHVSPLAKEENHDHA